MSFEDDVERAAEIISHAHRLVAFTGAGVSEESGIATFRDPGGVWERFNPDEVGTSEGILSLVARKPSVIKDFLLEVVSSFEKAAPNPGHLVLAELEKMGILHAVITQNVDDLHSQAGNTRVIEVHGNLFRFRCMSCHARRKLMKVEVLSLGRKAADALGRGGFREVADLLPHCSDCGSLMRPDVVMFGEAVQDLPRAFEEAGHCDAMVILGTSGVVYPAASIPTIAKQSGAGVIDINPGESAFSSILNVHIRAKSGKGLPRVLEQVKRTIS